jgi:hypothetical protein
VSVTELRLFALRDRRIAENPAEKSLPAGSIERQYHLREHFFSKSPKRRCDRRKSLRGLEKPPLCLHKVRVCYRDCLHFFKAYGLAGRLRTTAAGNNFGNGDCRIVKKGKWGRIGRSRRDSPKKLIAVAWERWRSCFWKSYWYRSYLLRTSSVKHIVLLPLGIPPQY